MLPCRYFDFYVIEHISHFFYGFWVLGHKERLPLLLRIFFFSFLEIELILDLYTVARNNTKIIPCTLCPVLPNGKFCKLLCNMTTRILTLIQPTNLRQISPVLVIHFCLCVYVYWLTQFNHFFPLSTIIDQDTEQFHYHKCPWYCLFITIPTSLSPSLWQPH